MIVKLLTEHHLEFLSLKGGYTGSSESTHFKMPLCWKCHALAQVIYTLLASEFVLMATLNTAVGEAGTLDLRSPFIYHWLTSLFKCYIPCWPQNSC